MKTAYFSSICFLWILGSKKSNLDLKQYFHDKACQIFNRDFLKICNLSDIPVCDVPDNVVGQYYWKLQ